MWGEGRAGSVNLDSTAPRHMALNVLGTISTSGQDGVTGTKFTLLPEISNNDNIFETWILKHRISDKKE